ncbi:hypothetical protein GCE9029_00826 [Grimontia celer]|uniref:Uncharacterized protein n=1 Tax=Grimontia celer TaxID=1796497 RepID=A0A128EWP8_9GAMM|nr:hypothetical protein GCE9029_00826 [Grimontia celer]
MTADSQRHNEDCVVRQNTNACEFQCQILSLFPPKFDIGKHIGSIKENAYRNFCQVQIGGIAYVGVLNVLVKV